jgi:hypothetical protein
VSRPPDDELRLSEIELRKLGNDIVTWSLRGSREHAY